MINKVKKRMDAFTFALGGMTVVGSYAAPMVVPNDHINKLIDERMRQNNAGEGARQNGEHPAAGGLRSLLGQGAG